MTTHSRILSHQETPLGGHGNNDVSLMSSADDNSAGIGIGIDLGTTFSAVAVLSAQDGIPHIIPIPGNGRTMPSVVSLEENLETKNDNNNPTTAQSNQVRVHVGKDACDRQVVLGGAYRNVKRVLGTGGKIPRDVASVVPFVLPNPKGKTYQKDSLSNQLYDAQHFPTLLRSMLPAVGPYPATILPETISSYVLQTLVAAAEQHTSQRVTRAVIGVPAYFHDAQRNATVQAAQQAGLQKVKLLREPEAAALAYGIGKEQLRSREKDMANDGDDDDELVLVFDLGGGTYDVSMLVVGGGVTEIISTSGDVKLGGSDFDRRVAEHLTKLLNDHVETSPEDKNNNNNNDSIKNWSDDAKNSLLRASEDIRIYLSNNRFVNLVLPLSENDWLTLTDSASLMVPDQGSSQTDAWSEKGVSNATHVLYRLSRRNMERHFRNELQALLRPLREVAIMAGALLPGDTSPLLVAAAMEDEDDDDADNEKNLLFDDFYQNEEQASTDAPESSQKAVSQEEFDRSLLLEVVQDLDMRQAKKAQQRGRKRARDVAKQERKYRQEKRKLQEQATMMAARKAASQGDALDTSSVKVRDGISGRPISRIVLVGGATRMPAIGRLLTALTGVVPQRTVNPDEAVALGCAVHVGVLDGVRGMGVTTVLNPMQAAILRAVAEQQQRGVMSRSDFEDDADDDEEFGDAEYF